VKIDCSTKCNPELTGEGIRWGTENFKILMKSCISSEDGEGKGRLTPDICSGGSHSMHNITFWPISISTWSKISRKMREKEKSFRIEKKKKQLKTH
jgi:hypothetical protein